MKYKQFNHLIGNVNTYILYQKLEVKENKIKLNYFYFQLISWEFNVSDKFFISGIRTRQYTKEKGTRA